MCRSSVWNVCEPTHKGGMRSDMAYRPAMGFLAHLMVHSVFILACSCRWSFTMVVVSVAGLSSVASFANLSALSFPSVPMCPGTHGTSMLALWFLLRNDIAASMNSCDICWLSPGFSSIIASTEDVLSANSTILNHLLSNSSVSCWKSIAASSPLSSASISASYTSAYLPIPLLPLLLSIPCQYITHPTPIQFSCSIPFIDLSVYVIIYFFFVKFVKFLFSVHQLLPLLWYLFGWGLLLASLHIVSPSHHFTMVGLCVIAMISHFSFIFILIILIPLRSASCRSTPLHSAPLPIPDSPISLIAVAHRALRLRRA